MAARGGPKLKEYRTAVTSVKQWQSEISFPQLSVVELFSSSFGNCQVILPTINSVMTNTPEAEKKVRWLTVNVAKLEEEQRLAEESEQKKEDEISGNTQRRPAASVSVAVIAPAPAASLPLPTIIDTQQQQAEHKQQTAQDAEDEEAEADGSQPASAVQPALDPSVPSLPLLEAWHGYDHPRPLWLFFLGGVLQYELTSANPPKMQRLVAACLSGEKLSVDELQGMELQTDSAEVAAEKRKARLLKKKQEEEAKRKAKEMEDAQQARKKREIVRTTPELLIHIALSSFTNVTSDSDEAAAAAAGGGRQPLLVLYWKDGDSDFYYHSQTLRTPPSTSGSVQFPTAVVWKKPDSPEAAAHLDLRLALYESADDEPAKGDRDGVRLLGEGFVNFAALLAGDNSVRILHRDPSIPPLSPTAKSPRVAARVDRLMATALLTVKDRVSEGVLTDYRFAVSVNGLAAPSAPADGAAADSANSYTVSVSALDDTTPVPLLLSTTEAASALPLVFSTPLSATHFSNLPRQLLFQLRTEAGAVINTAQVPLQSLLAKAGSTATLSTLDAAGEASGVELLLRVDEVDEDGNVVPTAAPALSEEEGQRRDALHWMQAAFSVHSLPPALITQQPLLALYQQEAAGGSSLLGLSSPPAAADSAADASAALSFTRSFFLPLDTLLLPTYKAVLLSSPSASSTEGATVVGQHLFDLSVLEGGAKSSVELTLETAEGAAIDGSLLRLNVTDVGRQGLLNLRFAASGLPTLPRGAEHTQASAVLAVWIQQADGSRELLGRTERVSESASPVFARRFQCPAYSLGSASLAVRLYDASAEDDALPADADCIAELTGCRLSALLYGDELSLPLAALDGSALPDARITVINESPIAKEATTDATPEVQPAEQKAEAVQPRPTSKAASRPASKAASRPASKSGKKTAAAEAELKVAVTSRRPSEAGQAAEVTALALTFDAAGLQAEDGSATLTVYAVDGGQEEQLGSTEAAVAGGAAAFAVPITIIASATADRSLRIAVQSGGQSRGELRLTVSSLSRVVGAASSFPLTSADQQLLPSTLTVRVNAQAEGPAAASSSSSSRPAAVPAIGAVPAAGPGARSARSQPPKTPSSSRPPLSSRTSRPTATPRTAAAAAAKPTAGSKAPSRAVSVQSTPRPAEKEEEAAQPASKRTTPKATPRPAPRTPTTGRREGSVSKKAETEAAADGDHARASSRSLSKKGDAGSSSSSGSKEEPAAVEATAAPATAAAEPPAVTDTAQANSADPQPGLSAEAQSVPPAAAAAAAESEPETAAVAVSQPETGVETAVAPPPAAAAETPAAAPAQAGEDEEYGDDTEPAAAEASDDTPATTAAATEAQAPQAVPTEAVAAETAALEVAAADVQQPSEQLTQAASEPTAAPAAESAGEPQAVPEPTAQAAESESEYADDTEAEAAE